MQETLVRFLARERSPGEGIGYPLQYSLGSLMAQAVRIHLQCGRPGFIQSLSWEDPPEEGMETHSSILAWRNPMDRGAWQLQSMRLQGVGHDSD